MTNSYEGKLLTDAAPFAAFDGANLLGLSTASNTVIHCGGKLLSGLDKIP